MQLCAFWPLGGSVAPWFSERPPAQTSVCARKLASDAFPTRTVFPRVSKAQCYSRHLDEHFTVKVGSSGNMGRLWAAHAGFSKGSLYWV